MNLLEGLNPAQREAVTSTKGPLLVLAGAGSGKTRVITRRAAYLAQNATKPEHVLAITFTNKAVGEMRERLEALNLAEHMTISTFHALGARLLRRFAGHVGYDPNFTIFDEADSRQALKQAIAEAGLSTSNWSPNMIRERISDAKNRLMAPEKYMRDALRRDFTQGQIARVYTLYQQILQKLQAVDFDDLLMHTAFLLGEYPELRRSLEDQYRYVLIDEYQDTNHAQYMIARGLTLENENICATGDPDQSIYAWRGADIRNILEFEHDFPGAKVVRLEQNYRSTQRILFAASQLIKANTQRKRKELWTGNDRGTAVRLVELEDAAAEAGFLVEDIQAYLDAGGTPSDVGVFYRINALSRVLEETFLRAAIPYQIARGTEFYNRREIKDLLAYLRVLQNPADEPALMRSISRPPRGIGRTTLDRLVGFARRSAISVFEAAGRVGEIREIKKTVAKRVKGYVELLSRFKSLDDLALPRLLETVFNDSGLERCLRDEQDDAALENVNELISAAADFARRNPEGKLLDWLEQVSLVSDVDRLEGSAGTVTFMTLHAAKGLEYPRVYIIGLEDGLLPYRRSGEECADLEEERRLCFVGMTRAMKDLTLTYARWRMTRGITLRSAPSEFLYNLEHDDVVWQRLPDEDAVEQSTVRVDLPQHSFDHLKKGMYVRHPRYGVGELLWKQSGGQRTHAGVRFPTYGEKTLILEYAKLSPLDHDECQL